mmetsp:Transcript_16287/g.26647  ORF Transcript_16287/g.26647 Transcript_16287/m.26647 type:complete len:421 (+) Transcript_16287:3-1265(+)
MAFKRSSALAAFIFSICLIGISADQEDSMNQTISNNNNEQVVCLIVRSGSNPYFDAMRSSAQRHATKLGLNLVTYVTSESGTVGGFAAAERNIALIQKCVTEDGAVALLLSIAADDPGSDTEAAAIENARAEHGVLALAIDSRINGVDALIQTNNTAAGEAIGQYALATNNKEDARIAVLYCPIEDDLNIYERIVGFVSGFGLSTQYTDPTTIDDPNSTRTIDFYSDPQIIAAREYKCSVADSGRDATLDILASNSGDDAPTIIYATNEVGGFGALEALREKGLSDSNIRIMTIDGSCNGVAEVYDGGFDANIIQQPGLMAQLGLDAVKAFLETGKAATGFTETPFGLAVKDQVYPYATLQTEAEDICWGAVDDGTSDLSGVGVGAGAMVGSEDTNSGGGTVVCSIGYLALVVGIVLASI